MVSSEEQNLTDTLVDPETLDNPSSYTKGEIQPTRCRDAWAALLFYGQFIAIAVVAGMLGVPAVQKATNGDDNSVQNGFNNSSDSPDYTGLLYSKYSLLYDMCITLLVFMLVHYVHKICTFFYVMFTHINLLNTYSYYSIINCRRKFIRFLGIITICNEHVSQVTYSNITIILIGDVISHGGSISTLW